MGKSSATAPFCFDITNNVHIEVIDSEKNLVRKKIDVHNKATRSMVIGLLRFLSGHFNETYESVEQPYYANRAKNYIPCYIGFGYGGTTPNNTPFPQGQQHEKSNRVPELYNDWNQKVDYNSNKMVLEVGAETDSDGNLLYASTRRKIRKVYNSFSTNLESSELLPNMGDMDGLFFLCETEPNDITSIYGNKNIFISELGLFASNVSGESDMLAYIKLGNYEDGVEKTNTLYIKPQDTVIIRWVITIAAVGVDSKVELNIRDEDNGNTRVEEQIVYSEFDPVAIVVEDGETDTQSDNG